MTNQSFDWNTVVAFSSGQAVTRRGHWVLYWVWIPIGFLPGPETNGNKKVGLISLEQTPEALPTANPHIGPRYYLQLEAPPRIARSVRVTLLDYGRASNPQRDPRPQPLLELRNRPNDTGLGYPVLGDYDLVSDWGHYLYRPQPLTKEQYLAHEDASPEPTCLRLLTQLYGYDVLLTVLCG